MLILNRHRRSQGASDRGIWEGLTGIKNQKAFVSLCSKKNSECMLGLKQNGYGFHVINISHATALLTIRINANEFCDKENMGIKIG